CAHMALASVGVDGRTTTIRILLERWPDLFDPYRQGGGGEPGLVLMPHDRGCSLLTSRPPRCDCYRRSVAQLEALLLSMRDDVALRALRWQLLERYLQCRVVVRELAVPSLDARGRLRRRRDGSVLLEPRLQPVPVFDARVEADATGAPRPGG